MEDFFASIIGFGILGILIGILVFVLICKFVIYLIKCGVVNALEEISFTDELENSVKMGVLQALIDFNNGNQNERPSE